MKKQSQEESNKIPRLFGYDSLKKKKEETASTSASPQLTRAEKKKKETVKVVKRVKESGLIKISGRLLEAAADPADGTGRRFRVALLQEGLGNLEDCYFYTKQAIESSPPIFEGAQFYVNHPSAEEEVVRPERDVRDIAGYFENVAAEAQVDGRMALVGDLVVLNGDAFDKERTIMLESIAYSEKHQDKDLVGLSINASGDFSSVAIDDFERDYQMPDSCKEKMLEAKAKGIAVVHPVTEMTSAVSCDLVTVAGASGRIQQLLEKGKKMARNKEGKKFDDKEAPTTDDKNDKTPPPSPDDKKPEDDQVSEDAADGDSDGNDSGDDEQDKELIQKMLSKYLGAADYSDEDKSLAHEAMKQAKEMGYEGEEAMKCAGYNMKMAKHMQKKEAGNPPGVENTPSKNGAQESQDKKDTESKKESSKGGNEAIRLAGEVARLQGELNVLRLEKHIETKLKESKLPMHATKKFREMAKGIKTVKDLDEKLSVFTEAFKIGGEAGDFSFVLGAEKTEMAKGDGQSFADCVE